MYKASLIMHSIEAVLCVGIAFFSWPKSPLITLYERGR